MSMPQRYWDARAAANFVCGGAGSGLLVAAAFLPAVPRLAVALALALIAAGLAAVWLEIGRKLRALHVFFNPFTSWMTRESLAASLVFLLGGGHLVSGWSLPLYGAGAAAAAFLYCQARILRAARGIPAWRAPEVVALVACTGLAEGLGLALLFASSPLALGVFALALGARLLAWQRYRAATSHPALAAADRTLLWLGTIAPALMIALAPALAWLAPLAGVTAFGAGAWLKYTLVTRASTQQDFSLPHLPVRGVR